MRDFIYTGDPEMDDAIMRAVLSKLQNAVNDEIQDLDIVKQARFKYYEFDKLNQFTSMRETTNIIRHKTEENHGKDDIV